MAIAPVGELGQGASFALDAATGLADTVIAVHVFDPHDSATKREAFQDDWEAAGPGAALVLACAAPDQIGQEIAGYIRRRWARREVHVVMIGSGHAEPRLNATPGPAAQLDRALRSDPHVQMHWLGGTP